MRTSNDVYKKYLAEKYVGGIQDAVPSRTVYKYKSAIEFVEFIEQVHKQGMKLRHSGQDSSMKSGGGWSGSKDMEEGIKFFREAKFDMTKAKKASNLILKMRQGVKYTDSGDELSVPEYLSHSNDYWIEYQERRRKKLLVMKEPIMINLTAHAGISEENLNRVASTVINSLYKFQVKAPKFILSYLAAGGAGQRGDLMVFVDVPYFDFNTMARFAPTSTFRRLIFTNYEICDSLSWGYGQPMGFPLPKTLRNIISLEGMFSKTDEQIEKIIEAAVKETFDPKKSDGRN